MLNRSLIYSTFFLFHNPTEMLLQEEGQDLRLNIREALLTMVDAFRPESANSTAHVPPCKAAANGSAATNTATLSKKNDAGSSPSVLPPELLQLQMQELLTRQIENPEPMVRFVVVRYAAVAFPPDHAPSRFLLLLASADRYFNNIFNFLDTGLCLLTIKNECLTLFVQQRGSIIRSHIITF